MDGPRDSHTESSKSNTDRQIAYDSAYVWNLYKKKVQVNLFIKQ